MYINVAGESKSFCCSAYVHFQVRVCESTEARVVIPNDENKKPHHFIKRILRIIDNKIEGKNVSFPFFPLF